jgi:hypothetical protein
VRFKAGKGYRIALASDAAATVADECVTVPCESLVILSAESD